MYKYYIFNQPTYSAKRALKFFSRNNREGCRINIMPYNNLWCNVEISLHPNYVYRVIMNYIAKNKDNLKCSDKAKQFINSYSSYKIFDVEPTDEEIKDLIELKASELADSK